MFTRVRVPLRAVGLITVPFTSFATLDVHEVWHGFEVLWVTAHPIPTQVVQLEPLRDWTHPVFVQPTMCVCRRPIHTE